MKDFLHEEWKTIITILAVFVVSYFLPVGLPRFDNAVLESLHLLKWYVREHVILCLIPAFFISGAISVFINQNNVIKYLGPNSNKLLAYGVASIAGSILAVCSCTILPLFNGIYKLGAGLGPACTFLYSGPAINVLAIVLSARILGFDIGIARTVGAIFLSLLIGLFMEQLFPENPVELTSKSKTNSKKDLSSSSDNQNNEQTPASTNPIWHKILLIGSLIGILVFANWGKPQTYVIHLTDGTSITGIIEDELHSQNEVIIKIFSDNKTTLKLQQQQQHHHHQQQLQQQLISSDVEISNVSSTQLKVEKSKIHAIEMHKNLWSYIWIYKWFITGFFAFMLMFMMVIALKISLAKILIMLVLGILGYIINPKDYSLTFVLMSLALCYVTLSSENEAKDWFLASWENAKLILPMLLVGVLLAGFLFGSVGKEGIIPQSFVKPLVGGNSIFSSFIASVIGAFMYFATLTEVPIVQGLINSGMGKGPAVALLLAGPALSLPSMIVINNIMGFKKTLTFITLTVLFATVYGSIVGVICGS